MMQAFRQRMPYIRVDSGGVFFFVLFACFFALARSMAIIKRTQIRESFDEQRPECIGYSSRLQPSISILKSRLMSDCMDDYKLTIGLDLVLTLKNTLLSVNTNKFTSAIQKLAY